MEYTDGLVMRCPACGALNILFKEYVYGDLRKCLSCEGSINTSNSIVYKLMDGPIT
jgi:uncharacterized protein (DUF983 family)